MFIQMASTGLTRCSLTPERATEAKALASSGPWGGGRSPRSGRCPGTARSLITMPTPTTATGVDDSALLGLRRWNIGLAVLHAVQAIAVLLLASSFAITIIASYAQGPPGSDLADPEPVLEVNIGWAIAAFLTLAAIDHFVTATVGRRRYEADLRRGHNAFRWVEYSFSATIMIVLIAFYNGIIEISAVFGVIGANVAMILFGWLQELMNPPGRTSRPCFRSGSAASPAPRRGWRSPGTS